MSIFENFDNLGKIKQDKLDYEHPLTDDELTNEDVEEKTQTSSSIYIIAIVIFAVFFIGRLFNLQIVKGNENQFLAEGNRLRVEESIAPRGIIFDKNKQPLVKNVPLYSLEIYPVDLPREKSERIKIYESLSEFLDEDLKDIIDEVENDKLYSNESMIVKSSLERDEAMKMQISLKDLPGVRVNIIPTRDYKLDGGLSHILGYIGKITQDFLAEHKDKYSINDYIGQNGLELAYEEYLNGKKGAKRVEVDSTGKIQRELETKDPVAGYDLVTTLDAGLQKKAEESLKNEIKKLEDDGKKDVKHGVVVAIDPRDGGVLAMVSIPSYDNNKFAQGIKTEDYEAILNDEENPMLNRAVSGIYPSGSIIKPVIAAAALDKGVIDENTTINDPGEIKIGEWVFPDWKNHGLVGVRKAIAVSCNVFFYAIGGGWENIKGMGVEVIDQYLDRFGFGKTTAIELPGEVEGNIPTPEWKEEAKGESWYLGDTYHLAIGQGDFLVTPLQMVNAVSAIANGGTLYKPHFVSQVVDSKGDVIRKFDPDKLSDSLVDNQYSIEVVRQGMREAVESDTGSARQLQDLPVSSAGKTGTAQYDANDLSRYHAWFTAFAPYEDPEIAIVVLVEKGGEGNEVAEPVANEILKYYFENKDNENKE